MDTAIGDIIKATAGREAGKLFFVVGLQEGALLLSDGKSRKLESPKRKKVKHTAMECKGGGRAGEKLRSNEKITNSELRKALAVYCGEQGNENQEG